MESGSANMNDEDLNACKISEKQWRCPVATCHQILSRKQTLQSHLLTSHDLRAGNPVKRYKRYESDASEPVPKSTKHAWQQKRPVTYPDASNLEECPGSSSSDGSKTSEESFCIGEHTCTLLSDPPSQAMSAVTDEIHNSVVPPIPDNSIADDRLESSDIDIDIDIDEFQEENYVDSEDNMCSSSDEEQVPVQHPPGVPDPPLFVLPPSSSLYSSSITRSQHAIATSAFCARHNLSDMAIKDLLTLLQLHLPQDNTGDTSIYELKEKCGFDKKYLTFHLYCAMCKKLFSDESENCNTPGCGGAKSDQECKKYFVTSDVKQQLKEILQRRGMLDAILEAKISTSEAISDICSGAGYKELQQPGGFLHKTNNITFSMFTDGVPLFKSSGVQIWPVYILINELPPKERFTRKNMILWGVWQGKGKPKMNMFLKPLVLDLLELYNTGLTINTDKGDYQVKAKVVVATMDLQARAYVTNMTQHNGEYGCLYCEEPGEVVASGAGSCRSYPVREDPAPLRTADSTNNLAKQAHNDGKRHKGFLGLSVLHYLPYFSMTNNIVIDYMHGTLLGVTKKLLELWFDTKHAGMEYYIGHEIGEVDKILRSIKPPYMVHRLPRILSNTYSHWKASELRNWLLFYAVPCLEEKLSTIYLKHFSCLVEATYILLSEGISQADLMKADTCLNFFVSNAGFLYGNNFLSLNVHNLTHLTACVKMWGPLWGWSCFPFESFNGEIKKNIHGTGNVCRQIFWTFQAQKRILQAEEHMADSPVRDFVTGMFEGKGQKSFGSEAHQCRVIKLTEVKSVVTQESMKDKIKEVAGSSDKNDFMTASKVFRNGFFLYSSKCSKVKKQNSYTIALEQVSSRGDFAFEVEQFLYHKETKHVFAAGRLLKSKGSILKGYINHIHRLEYSDLTIVKAECLREPIMVIKKNTELYGALFPNHFERD